MATPLSKVFILSRPRRWLSLSGGLFYFDDDDGCPLLGGLFYFDNGVGRPPGVLFYFNNGGYPSPFYFDHVESHLAQTGLTVLVNESRRKVLPGNNLSPDAIVQILLGYNEHHGIFERKNKEEST